MVFLGWIAAACAAPERLDLSGDRDWLNVSREISNQELNGRVVLLDFWTFCCINCMHVIPDLKYLEQKFGDRLLVVGVHSAKFTNEQSTQNIRNAIARYEIHHPVINDHEFKIWNRYQVEAWPTFLLFSQKGELVLRLSGEGHRKRLEDKISELLSASDVATLPALPIKVEPPPSSLLHFPGKVISDDKAARFFVSNSSAHSILEVSNQGSVLNQIGTSTPGFKDGDFATAQFARPQGLALQGDQLYIADTENNAIRVANLQTKIVTTLASDGLSSPWDLVIDQNKLLVAMSGSHQIWEIDRSSGHSKVLIGSGAENIYDGDFLDAALAQPSGLALVGRKLYIADSEVSAVREADLDTKQIKTLIGSGLFAFGDKDGDFAQAKLQHPLGIAHKEGKLILADSYNHKIKLIDLATRKISTLLGTNEVTELNEPAGIAVSDHGILVADTNNNRIRLIKTDGKVETVDVVQPIVLQDLDSNNLPNVEVIKHQKLVSSASDLTLQINFELPKGFHINQEAPSQVTVWRGSSAKTNLSIRAPKNIIKLPQADGELHILATIYYCPIELGSTCEIKSFNFTAALESSQSGSNPLSVELNLPAAKVKS